MGLFNRKNPEGRHAEEHTSEPTNAELEVGVEERAMPDPIAETDDMRIEASVPDMNTESADPFGDELRELEEKAVADEPPPAAEQEPEAEVVPAPVPEADAPGADVPAGKLDKEELRRAVKGANAEEDEADDDGRRSADDLIGPTMRKRHPYAPEPVEPSKTSTMKVIAFANQKGGVAKTTTTLNLAVALCGVGPPRALRRPGPAGQPDDEPGDRPRHAREEPMYDVLVHHMPITRGHPHARDRRRRAPRSTWPAPRSR